MNEQEKEINLKRLFYKALRSWRKAALAGAIARELLGLCPAFDCLDEYRARCFVPGHWVTVCTGMESYAAKAVAIDDAGRLIVAREGGRTEVLCHGEVSIRPSPLAVK